MSCNIDNWKTKKLENLVIPLKEFYTHSRKDFHPKKPVVLDAETMLVSLDAGEGEIEGLLKEGNLHVTQINLTNEFSGTFHREVFKPALEKSTGILEATLVWEVGEIEKFKCKNGVITEENIDV